MPIFSQIKVVKRKEKEKGKFGLGVITHTDALYEGNIIITSGV